MEKFNYKKHRNEFINGNVIVHCKTKELSDEFLRYCRNNFNDSLSNDVWYSYNKETCFTINNKKIYYCSQSYYKKECSNKKILEFTGFEIQTTKSNNQPEIVTYEQQPYKAIWINKSNKETDKRVVTKDIEKFSFKAIFNNKTTIVILKDGSKGISKCMPEDKYDLQKGLNIAYRKAMIKYYQKQLKELCK